MNKKLVAAVSAALAVCMLFAGCGKDTPPETTTAPETTAVAETTAAPETTEAAPATEATEAAADSETVNVYIGTVDSGFTAYPVELNGPLSPEALIAGMEDLTGWNLSLAEPVTTGKGGMTVIFAEDCALISGPPAVQKEDFHVFDVDSLVVTVLDSVQETLRRNYVGEEGDPAALDIYFSINNGDIDIPNTDIHYSQYEPWDSSALHG